MAVCYLHVQMWALLQEMWIHWFPKNDTCCCWPWITKNGISQKWKVHLYYDIHSTDVSITQYTSDHMNNRNTWIIQVSGVTWNHSDCCAYKFRNVCIVSNFCNFPENLKTCGKSVLRIKKYVLFFVPNILCSNTYLAT